jgi:ribosome production factor 2
MASHDFGSAVSRKPTTRRGKRVLEERGPKLVENEKTALFVRGGKCGQEVTELLKDLYQLKKPNAVSLKHRNPIHPFDDETPLERFGAKYDASLFAFGSHSKKRPKNVLFGRLYRYHLLDAFEMGLEEFRSLKSFKTAVSPLGAKPCLTFVGEQFYNDAAFIRLRNFFTDFFRGADVEQLRLQGVEVLLAFYALPDGSVAMRGYKMELKKSGTRVPRVELVETGPSCKFQPRRTRLASDDAFKTACRQPKAAKIRVTKNINRDVFGTKLGRVHVKQQDLAQLRTRKVRGLKPSKEESAAKKRKLDQTAE